MASKRYTIILVVDSFSTTSGGRTSSVFQRAGFFQQMGHEVYIATRNLKPGYAKIFTKLCRKHHATGIGFLNFYEYLNEGELYSTAEDEDPDSNRLVRDAVDSGGKPVLRQLCDRNGRVFKSEVIRQSQNSARVDASTHANSIDWENDDETWVISDESKVAISQASFFDPKDGRIYYVTGPNSANGQGRRVWYKRDGSKRLFSDGTDALAFWYAQLNAQYENVVFMLEEHSRDSALLDNPYDGSMRAIATVHSTFFDPPFTYGSPLRPYYEAVLSRAEDYSAIIFITEQEKAHAENYFGPRSNQFVIPHPCSNLECISAQKKPDTIVVCTRLVEVKRIEHMIHAVSMAIKRRPNIQLLIYGAGDCESRLGTLIDELGVRDTVHLCGFTDKPLEAIAQGSLSLATSSYEGFSLSISEALSVGTPVISYDFLYGPKDLIRNGENGVLVRNGDVEALADAIVDLLDNPEKLARMQQSAFKFAPSFSEESIKSSWEHVFDYVDTTSDDCLSRYSVLLGASVVGGIGVSESLMGGDSVTIEIRTHGVSRATAYALVFYGSKHVEINESLVVPGELVDRRADADVVEFECSIPTDEICQILDDVDEMRLYVQFGKYCRWVALQ